jgi:hypothetical protein
MIGMQCSTEFILRISLNPGSRLRTGPAIPDHSPRLIDVFEGGYSKQSTHETEKGLSLEMTETWKALRP